MESVTIGDATVYHGNALEIMPTLDPVDLVWTDAPYLVSQGGFAGNNQLQGGFGGWMKDYGNKGDIVACELDWSDWLPLAFEVLKPNCHAYFMTNGKSLKDAQTAAEVAGFELHTILVWDKRSALPNQWYQNITEFALFMRKGKAFRINDCASKNLFSYHMKDESEHPTEKPVEWIRQHITNSTKRGQTVLDPFMGSGSTGVAAARTGRKFIGIEIERKWFDVACERISKAKDQGDIFEAQASPVQTDLLE